MIWLENQEDKSNVCPRILLKEQIKILGHTLGFV